VSKIKDGGQLNGSSNISESMKHIIKIPTANLRHRLCQTRTKCT